MLTPERVQAAGLSGNGIGPMAISIRRPGDLHALNEFAGLARAQEDFDKELVPVPWTGSQRLAAGRLGRPVAEDGVVEEHEAEGDREEIEEAVVPGRRDRHLQRRDQDRRDHAQARRPEHEERNAELHHEHQRGGHGEHDQDAFSAKVHRYPFLSRTARTCPAGDPHLQIYSDQRHSTMQTDRGYSGSDLA